jgi:glycine hydroxymethyltransferase
MSWMRSLQDTDPQVAGLIARETARQEQGLELIASENFVSPAVLEALGTSLTNKYAEGYPGRRYYGGCEVVDEIEQLAIDRACQLFKADHANVQPHSGASANLAAYLAVLQPGDKVMGLSLSHGGHLTHGSPVNFSGRLFSVVAYGVEEDTGRIDMNKVRELAVAERPRMIIAGGSAYARVFDFPAFASIAEEVDAVLMVDMAHFAGLVAGGVHPDPVAHAQIVTSTAHKTLRGPRGGFVLCREDYKKAIDKTVFPGLQGGPLEHVIAAKAVAFGEALQPEFRAYAQQVVANAQTLASALMERGYDIVSGGTDTHLLLMDLRSADLTGKVAEEALGAAGIHVNKNTVPGDQRSPFVTSGLRLGTPALTTRGMGESEMVRVAGMIDDVLKGAGAPSEGVVTERVGAEVRDLAAAFPLYAAEEAAP